MLVLCGFSASNYYNKVKLALLEKEVPFEEKVVWTDRSPALLEKSPFGKVPYFEIGDQVLCESQVMLDYVEAAYPSRPLLPANPLAAAKVRELIQFIELHFELVARQLYAEAFFGGKVSDETKERVKKVLTRHAKALGRFVTFSPFIGGSEFTMADCAAAVHLPMVSSASKAIYGEDVLADYPVNDYRKRLLERPTMQKVNADRKVSHAEMMERFGIGNKG